MLRFTVTFLLEVRGKEIVFEGFFGVLVIYIKIKRKKISYFVSDSFAKICSAKIIRDFTIAELLVCTTSSVYF